VKVLLIGGGGREHCLAWKISASDMVEEVYAVPGNAGIKDIAHCIDMGISAKDFQRIADIAESESIGMVVVGPEAPRWMEYRIILKAGALSHLVPAKMLQ
jgi:phosphoribosylamine--glycine ligase